ncbi:MAG: hypothetical protein Q9162_004863 [Coniocarpon cinnabarinum]
MLDAVLQMLPGRQPPGVGGEVAASSAPGAGIGTQGYGAQGYEAQGYGGSTYGGQNTAAYSASSQYGQGAQHHDPRHLIPEMFRWGGSEGHSHEYGHYGQDTTAGAASSAYSSYGGAPTQASSSSQGRFQMSSFLHPTAHHAGASNEGQPTEESEQPAEGSQDTHTTDSRGGHSRRGRFWGDVMG